MKHLVSLNRPIAGKHTVRRYAGFGIKGADIPTGGDNGGSPVLNDSVNAASEYYWRLETPPGSGTVVIYPDLSFEHAGAANGTWPWVYRLYWVDVDGTAGSGTATVTDIFGAGAVALVIANAVQGHTADGAGLTTQWLLTVSEVLNTHVADVATLGSTGSTALSISEGTHAHFVDNITLATEWVLSIAEALHAHAADNQALDTSSAVWLTVQDVVHANEVGQLSLSTQAWLAVAEAAHAHFCDIAVMSEGGQGAAYQISDADVSRIVEAVMQAIMSTTVPADMKKTNGHDIIGDGTTGNKFRSHLVP